MSTLDAAADVAAEAERLDAAEAVLGYRFVERAHLLRALTHSSYKNERPAGVADNEVLELLGDSVLSLVVVEALVRNGDGAGEGELTERRAAHVSAPTLAKAAATTGLDRLLRTGKGLTGGRPDNVIADVVEAALGAVWLDAGDGGLTACRAVVQRLLGPPPASATVVEVHAKRSLQERLQRLFGRPPDYDVRREDGPNHAPVFVAEVRFDTHLLGQGRGKNKRAATEAAAGAALDDITPLTDDTLRARLRRRAPTDAP